MPEMKRVTVQFFKPSGKFYEEEHVDMPVDIQPWHDLGRFLRIKNMHAVFQADAPWGFPLLVTASENAS